MNKQNLNRSVTNELNWQSKNHSTEKGLGPKDFTGEYYHTF